MIAPRRPTVRASHDGDPIAARRGASPGRVLIYARAADLGLHLPVSDLLDADDLVQARRVDVTQGHLIPWVDFMPDWKGWRSLGLSPDTIFDDLERARRVPAALRQQHRSPRSARSALAIVIGSLAAYGLSRFDYKFGPWRNKDISFFFLSQLILPPVVLALPFLVLYKELALLDTKIGLILIYTLMVLPIVIWIMRDQFGAIPIELEQAALVDGCSIWGAFFRIVLPIALPGMVAAFILSVVLCWNEYFFAVAADQHRRHRRCP